MQKHLEIVGLFLLLLCCLLRPIPSPSPLMKGFDEEERKESSMNVVWCEPGFTQQGSGLAQAVYACCSVKATCFCTAAFSSAPGKPHSPGEQALGRGIKKKKKHNKKSRIQISFAFFQLVKPTRDSAAFGFSAWATASGAAGSLHPAVPVFLLCVSLLLSLHGSRWGTGLLPPASGSPSSWGAPQHGVL